MTLEQLATAANHTNVRAFLRAIRLGEGTLDEAGYRRIVGDIPPHASMTSCERHPNRRVWIRRYGVFSTAAGAYQITYPTWRGLVKQYHFADFMPHTQDMAAVALIREKGALEDVKAGRLSVAIDRCGALWASLPSSKAGQRKVSYAQVENVYRDAGGTLTA